MTERITVGLTASNARFLNECVAERSQSKTEAVNTALRLYDHLVNMPGFSDLCVRRADGTLEKVIVI